jgi:hypothetical protein
LASLKQRLEGYIAHVASRLARLGVVEANQGLVDVPQRYRDTEREGRCGDIDVLFINFTSYAL